MDIHDYSKVTTVKRINKLYDKGLVFIRKIGRSKSVFKTEKGRSLIEKRQNI